MGSGLFSGLLRVFGIGFEGQIWCRCFHDWFRGFTWFNLGVRYWFCGFWGGEIMVQVFSRCVFGRYRCF